MYWGALALSQCVLNLGVQLFQHVVAQRCEVSIKALRHSGEQCVCVFR